MTGAHPTVAVVGGGVVGLCCAESLLRAGAEVAVLERGRLGAGASAGNAGWITPAFSAPLAAPGVVRTALGWMLRPDSPFRLRPRLDPALAGWLWRFWRSSSRERYRHGMRAMIALNRRTLRLFDALEAAAPKLQLDRRGIIFCFLTEHAREEWTAQFAELRALGYEGDVDVLDGARLRQLEPAVSPAVVGAIRAQAERYVRPERLTDALVERLRAAGADLREGTEVRDLRRVRAGWLLETRAGDVRAERVVVAGGAWSGGLLARAGVRIPLEGAKGYSVTTPGSGDQPGHALYLTEAKIACTPFSDSVRLAGTLELAGLDVGIPPRRIAALGRAAAAYLTSWRPTRPNAAWAGLRPLAPDGLPFIGAAPGREGLFAATGHGMMGLTLAPATAEALTPLVLEGRLVPELEPFRLDRALA